MFFAAGRDIVNIEEKRKFIHELIDKMDELQISRLYQLIRGMFGKVL